MAAEKENTINIDDYRIFNNPFEKFEPSEDSFKLFEKYLDCKANKDILQKIGDNKITSSEYSGFGPTKDEILRKVACKNNYRTKCPHIKLLEKGKAKTFCLPSALFYLSSS